MVVLGAVLLTIGLLSGVIAMITTITLEPLDWVPIFGALMLVDVVSLCVAALVLFNLAGVG